MVCSVLVAAMLGFLNQAGVPSGPVTQTAKAVSPTGSAPGNASAEPARPPITREQRGDIFMARKMYLQAVEQYEAAPQTAVVLNKIGIAYHQLQDLQTARKYYEKAVHADRKYSDAINNLGAIYYSEKSYRRAVSQYRKALKLSPSSATIYSNLGTAYYARNDMKRAMENYQAAFALDP